MSPGCVWGLFLLPRHPTKNPFLCARRSNLFKAPLAREDVSPLLLRLAVLLWAPRLSLLSSVLPLPSPWPPRRRPLFAYSPEHLCHKSCGPHRLSSCLMSCLVFRAAERRPFCLAALTETRASVDTTHGGHPPHRFTDGREGEPRTPDSRENHDIRAAWPGETQAPGGLQGSSRITSEDWLCTGGCPPWHSRKRVGQGARPALTLKHASHSFEDSHNSGSRTHGDIVQTVISPGIPSNLSNPFLNKSTLLFLCLLSGAMNI